MSARGVKYNFEPGEYVLCFEPDATKARVLYDAKILNLNKKTAAVHYPLGWKGRKSAARGQIVHGADSLPLVVTNTGELKLLMNLGKLGPLELEVAKWVLDLTCSRDKRGNWKPEYTVHFQGWNSSWDRIVPETFVQKNSAENRALMKRLAIVARNVKKNRSRKRRIDVLLKQHFKRKMPPDSSDDSSGDDNTDDDEDDDDGDESTDLDGYNDHNQANPSSTEEEDLTQDEETEDEKEHSDGLELHGPHNVDLEIPPELRVKLEDDCYFINRKKRLVTLPAEPNVLTILEGYVKNFALNILYGTVEKPRLRDNQNNITERNIDLCKEVMDGLRVFFDFTLPTILLYNPERAHYEKALAAFKPMLTAKQEISDSSPPPAVTSPRLRSSARQPQSPEGPASGGGGGEKDLSPRLPRLSPKGVKREREPDLSDDDTNLPPRRMTRHAYQAEIRSRGRGGGDGSHKSSSSKTPSAEGAGSGEKRRSHGESSDAGGGGGAGETRRRESLRSSARHTADTGPPGSGQKGSGPLSDRVTPPPPLLIPSVISSKASKGSSSPHHTPTYKSRCSTPTLADPVDKEGMMNGVLAWKLIPDDTLSTMPPAPSAVCGAIHLLRLFVRLPDLINQMSIPDAGIKPLVKHLGMFLEYLADNSEELFPESTYIEGAEGSGGRGTTKR